MIVAALVLCGTQTSNAQGGGAPKSEISLSYGYGSSSGIIDVFDNFSGAIFGDKYDNGSYIGPIGLEYFYHYEPRLAFGLIGVYNHYKQDIIRSKTEVGKRTNNFFTLMPAIKCNWLIRDSWSLYTKTGIGYTYGHTSATEVAGGKDIKESSNSSHFNFQVSLVGVEVGGYYLRGFAELGFGEQGVINAGLRYRF